MEIMLKSHKKLIKFCKREYILDLSDRRAQLYISRRLPIEYAKFIKFAFKGDPRALQRHAKLLDVIIPTISAKLSTFKNKSAVFDM